MALVACAAGTPSDTFDPRASGQPVWSSPFSVTFDAPDFYDMSVANSALVVSRTAAGDMFTGIDLARLRVVWTVTEPGIWTYYGDATGLVTAGDGQLVVRDPRTGRKRAAVVLEPWKMLRWAGDGMILIDDYSTSSLCASAMTAPATCVWTAPDVVLPQPLASADQSYVFGAGRWVNTGSGVVEMATGQRASFGRDAGSGQPAVYYTGTSPARVFRVGQAGVFQPWDTARNIGVSPPISADRVRANPSSHAYVAIVQGTSGTDTVAGYSWQTGSQVWQASGFDLPGVTASQFVGDAYVMQTQGDAYGWTVVSFDSTTGRAKWRSANYPNLIGVLQGVVVLGNANAITSFDSVHQYVGLWSVDMPDGCVSMHIVADHVICTDNSSSVWVLRS